jgi:uncharacterized protein
MMTRMASRLLVPIALGAAAFAVRCAGSRPPASPPAAAAAETLPRCLGTLGLEAAPLSREVRKRLSLPADARGALVVEVPAGGPGAAAGIRSNDVIEEIGPVRIQNDCDFVANGYSRACGPVRVVVRREGKSFEATLLPVDQAAFYEKSCRDGIASSCFRQAWIAWPARSEAGSRTIDLFEATCKAGSADACAYAGLQMLRADRGSEAVAVLERSCDLGSAGGCASFAFLFGTGKSVKRDDRRALALYKKACDGGDAQGCYNVGLMADGGRGGPANLPLAVARYEEACDLGSSTGCTNLGYLYEHGRGVKTDKARALELYRKGCDGTSCQPSNLNGCVNVGRAYRDGLGVARNEPRAASIFREACDRKPDPSDADSAESGARACSLLGGLYLAGDGIEKDLVQGRELSELGCERHDSFGCFNAAAVYAAGSGVATDPARAASFLDRACREGDAEGCHDLAVAYQKGNGVVSDRHRAAELFQKACRLGFAAACSKSNR